MKTTIILRISVLSLAIIAACGTCNATDPFTRAREEAQKEVQKRIDEARRRIGNGYSTPQTQSTLSQNGTGTSRNNRVNPPTTHVWTAQQKWLQQQQWQKQQQQQQWLQQQQWQKQQQQQQLQQQQWQMQMLKQQEKAALYNGIFGAFNAAIQQGQQNSQGQQYYQGRPNQGQYYQGQYYQGQQNQGQEYYEQP